MKNNKYTERIKSISAPQQSVERAVEAALEAEKTGYHAKKSPMRKFGAARAAAAALVVIIAGGAAAAILTGQSGSQVTSSWGSDADSQVQPQSKNTFSLMVNAAEINEEDYVDFVDLDYSSINKILITGAFFNSYLVTEDSETEQRLNVVIYPDIPFSMTCTGNNIKSVTYSLNNAAFQLSGKYMDGGAVSLGIMEVGDISDIYNYRSSHDGISSEPEDTMPDLRKRSSDYNESITINYDNGILTPEEINSEIRSECFGHGLDNIRIRTKASDSLLDSDNGSAREAAELLTKLKNMDEYLKFKHEEYRPDLKKALFCALVNEISIDVTVRYKDGQSERCTIMLETDGTVSEDEDYLTGPVSVKARLVREESKEAEDS